MRAALQLSALLITILAGCAPQPDDEPEVETRLPSAVPEPGWTLDHGDLVLHGEDGALLARFGCSAGPPAKLQALFTGFERIGSEERLSLGLGDYVLTMVVGAEGAGVIASARYSRAVGEELTQAGSISASYGVQSFGPVGPPAPAQVERLMLSCTG